jgi:hypothetical protein
VREAKLALIPVLLIGKALPEVRLRAGLERNGNRKAHRVRSTAGRAYQLSRSSTTIRFVRRAPDERVKVVESSATPDRYPEQTKHVAAEWIGTSPPSGGLRTYLDLLRARWLLIAIVVALAALTAAVVVTNRSKQYSAEANVLVTPVPASDTDLFGLGLVPESGDPTRDAETLAQLIKTDAVAQLVRSRLGLHQSARSLLNDVRRNPSLRAAL